MPATTTFAVFAAAALALLVVPGPAVLYVVTRSLDQGRLAGIVSVLGVGLGSLVHVTAAAVGLSALLASSAVAFATVKYLGAAYLVWLGVRTLRRRDDAQPPPHPAGTPNAPRAGVPHPRLFAQGALVQVLNPKTAIFFVAFLPQFVDPSVGAATRQIVSLGAVFVVLQVASDGAYALLAGTFGDWLRRSATHRRTLRYVSGGVYVGLGAAAALSGGRPTDR